ncbi:alcohol dehydrogenase catalytic domain-containing protein [Streptomyces sp. TS71-3]|uniref:alcohol dehydrogenase catalytic domain-containing protein n=1 Tax=Streptomyces sp. TS71-3 TaxID=2733862 RepID=UPI001B21F790|nr:alcohol dehydrogenase catalytic domain-containing protein [Streptomyces sp. TS71-3]GHJ42316.1 alcohol dehydrogenase [Streptomyces sp. TS71-3]
MKALVFHGSGRLAWEAVPDPGVQEAGDAVVRVEATTICGTDLDILRGEGPAVRPGTVLGHEAVGEVVETGPEVRAVQPGDRVVVSCISACGRCGPCRLARYGQCRGGGGWLLGRRIDGTQAEYVRVPWADLSVHPLPGVLSSRDAVLLADVLPTGYEVGVLAGDVRPGDTVAVVGAGPVGLAAVATAQLVSPERTIAVDLDAARLDTARRVGADAVVNASDGPEQLVSDLTGSLGADVVIEAVGAPETFEMCTRMVGSGGRLANVGVQGKPAALHLEELWDRDVTISTGLVDTRSLPTLLRLMAAGRLPASELITHDFPLAAMEEAYDVFARARATAALKVVLGEEPHDALDTTPRTTARS